MDCKAIDSRYVWYIENRFTLVILCHRILPFPLLFRLSVAGSASTLECVRHTSRHLPLAYSTERRHFRHPDDRRFTWI